MAQMLKNADVDFATAFMDAEVAAKDTAQFNMPDSELLVMNKYWVETKRNNVFINWSAIQLPDFSWKVTAQIVNSNYTAVYGKPYIVTVEKTFPTFDLKTTVQQQVAADEKLQRAVNAEVQAQAFIAGTMTNQMKHAHVDETPEQKARRKPLVLPVGNQSHVVGKIMGAWKRPPQMKG